ncbi:hypothetical protein GCM10027262_32500 [Nocardia tengchongensis]
MVTPEMAELNALMSSRRTQLPDELSERIMAREGIESREFEFFSNIAPQLLPGASIQGTDDAVNQFHPRAFHTLE